MREEDVLDQVMTQVVELRRSNLKPELKEEGAVMLSIEPTVKLVFSNDGIHTWALSSPEVKDVSLLIERMALTIQGRLLINNTNTISFRQEPTLCYAGPDNKSCDAVAIVARFKVG